MATQPLYQSHSEPVALVSKSSGDRALLAPGLAASAVERTAAALPALVREASLDEITITEMATSLISLARSLLSAEMYSKFLAWGIAAALFASEYDAEGDALCARTVDALTAISLVSAWTFHDFMLKAWLFGLEVCDSPQFGPLSVRSQDSQLLVMKIAEGVATDLSRSSPIVAALQRLASFAGDQSSRARGFSFAKPVGDLIAAAFLAAQQVSDAGTAQPAWDTAMAQYLAADRLCDITPVDDPEADARVDACCGAMDHLIENVRAHDLGALNIKLDLALGRAECFEDVLFDDHARGIIADIRHLANEPLTADPHVAWLADRNRALLKVNRATEADLSEELATEQCSIASALEGDIAGTPARSTDGVIAKLALIVQTALEGSSPDPDWCASALMDARRIAGIGSLDAAADARHREMAA